MSYPAIITEKELQDTELIANDVIQKDIQDTKSEIAWMELEAEGYHKIADAKKGMPDGKMAYFRATATDDGIKERKEFVAFLEKLLVARKEQGK